jgi:acyl-coenzyme A synthetase/AMP-(fatty) acid ligase
VDGFHHNGKVIKLKEMVDEAMLDCPAVEHVVVVKWANIPVDMTDGRYMWYEDLVEGESSYFESRPMDAEGERVPPDKGGFLVIKEPWPAMVRTLYKDPEKYKEIYWSKIPGVYFTGDTATRDEDGYFWLQGRSDDVLKIAGHRIGTAPWSAINGWRKLLPSVFRIRSAERWRRYL